MDSNDLSPKKQRMAKRCGFISTLLYLLLFPMLFYFSLFSFMAFDNPHMTIALGSTYIFLFLSIPLSIPTAIFFIWLKYSRGEYQKSLVFCTLPLLIATISMGLIELLDTLF